MANSNVSTKKSTIIKDKISEILDNELLDSEEKKIFLEDLQEAYSYQGGDYNSIQRAINSIQGISGNPYGKSLEIAAEMRRGED